MFSGAILLLAEKVFLRYVAINFHRKALADRLAENRLGLEALDRLSNAQPSPSNKRNPYGPNKRGHKSFGSLDMLGFGGRHHHDGSAQPGSSNGSPTNEKQQGNGHRSQPSVDTNYSKKLKVSNAERRKRRKNAVATVLVDGLGGAIGQVTLKDSKLHKAGEFGSLASAGKLARKLFSTLSDVHPPRSHLIVDGTFQRFSVLHVRRG